MHEIKRVHLGVRLRHALTNARKRGIGSLDQKRISSIKSFAQVTLKSFVVPRFPDESPPTNVFEDDENEGKNSSSK